MLTVRLMKPGDDFHAAAQVYVDSWKHAYQGLVPQRYLDKLQPDGFISLLRADPSANLILEENGQIVGTAYVSFARDELREGYGEIVSLYLLPSATGKGYGKLLLQAALNQCRENGLTHAMLWVLSDNHHACHFYERMGLEKSGRTKTDAIGGAELPLTEYIVRLDDSGQSI